MQPGNMSEVIMRNISLLGCLGFAGVVAIGSAGCATRGYVRDRVAELHAEMGSEDARLRTESERIDRASLSALASADSARAGLGSVRDLALGRVDFREASRSRVYFARGSSRLTPESQAELDAVALTVRNHSQYVVDVYGFADATGSADLNYTVGRRRADAVERYLVERTGSLGRYRSISFGEMIPASEAGRMSRPEERRQALVILLERIPAGEHPEEFTAR